MARRLIELDGATWSVSFSGRYTQYNKDEFTLVFRRLGDRPEERVARYSPLATKQREESLARLTDRELALLFERSQPSWTAAEAGYRR